MMDSLVDSRIRLFTLVPLVRCDEGYGVIRWKQQRQFGRAVGVDFRNPDLVAFASSHGAAGRRVSDPAALGPLLREALRADGPTVIECPVDYAENPRLLRGLTAGK